MPNVARSMRDVFQILNHAIHTGSMTRFNRTAKLADWLNKPIRDLPNASLDVLFRSATLDLPPNGGKPFHLVGTYERWLQAQYDKNRDGHEVAREIYAVLKEYGVAVETIAEFEANLATTTEQSKASPTTPVTRPTHRAEISTPPAKPSTALATSPPNDQRFERSRQSPASTPERRFANADPKPVTASTKPQTRTFFKDHGGYLAIETDGLTWHVLKNGQYFETDKKPLNAADVFRSLGINRDAASVMTPEDLLKPSVRAEHDLELADVSDLRGPTKVRAKDRNRPVKKARSSPDQHGS